MMNVKGTTEIILTDSKTGKVVQHIKEENTVTNGVAGYLKNHGLLNTTPFTNEIWDDLIPNLFGGVLLFDKAQTNDANTTFVEAGTKMIANATYGYLNSGNPQEMGSYDADRTGWQNGERRQFRFVYNWTETQGNGTINSVCLTSRIHGFEGEGNAQSNSYKTDNNYTWQKMCGVVNGVGFSSENYDLYHLYLTSDGDLYSGIITNQVLKVYKIHVCNNIIDFRDNISGFTFPDDWEEVLTYDMSSLGIRQNTNPVYPTTRKTNDNFYIAYQMQLEQSQENAMLVLKLSSDLSTVIESTIITKTNVGFTNNALIQPVCFSEDATKLLIAGNNETDKLYGITISTPSIKTEYSRLGRNFNNNADSVRSQPEYGKRHHIPYGMIWDEELDRLLVTNASNDFAVSTQYLRSSHISCDDKTITPTENRYYSGFPLLNTLRRHDYLATVNNLSSSITKESSQTMRVIYTLTFLDTTE